MRLPPFKLILVALGSILVLTQNIFAQQHNAEDIDKLYETAIELGSKNYDSTFSIAQKIYQISLALDDNHGIAKAKLLASYYYWDLQKTDTAQVLLNECLNFFANSKKLQNSFDHGRVWYCYALVSLRRQEIRLAKVYAEHALKIFKEHNNTHYQGNALNVLGGIEMSLSNYTESLQFYSEAYRMRIDGEEDEEKMIPELSNISRVYSIMGQFEKAQEYARKTYAIQERIGDYNSQINTLNTIGTIKSNMKQYDSALYYYEASKAISLTKGNTFMAFLADYNIANVYNSQGEFDISNNLLNQAIATTSGIPSGLSGIVNLLFAKNYLNAKDFDKSIFYGTIAYRSSIDKANKQSTINTTQILADAYKAKGKFDSAYHFLQIHYSFKDSVYSQENQRKLSTVYAELETIQKQKEIEILQKEKERKDAEARIMRLIIFFGLLTTLLIITSITLAYRNREKKQRIAHYKLQYELEEKKKDLHQQTLRIINTNNNLSEIEKSLRRIKPEMLTGNQQNDVQQILNTIQLNKTLEKEWENFNVYFGNVHTGFYEKIDAQYPDLSLSEKRLAGLIKMNLSNREIASILNIEPSSVKMAKYRLKKKLCLKEHEDVNGYLQHLN